MIAEPTNDNIIIPAVTGAELFALGVQLASLPWDEPLTCLYCGWPMDAGDPGRHFEEAHPVASLKVDPKRTQAARVWAAHLRGEGEFLRQLARYLGGEREPPAAPE